MLVAAMILILLAAVGSFVGALLSDTVTTDVDIDGGAEPDVGFSVGLDGVAWGANDQESDEHLVSVAALAELAALEIDGQPVFPEGADLHTATVSVEVPAGPVPRLVQWFFGVAPSLVVAAGLFLLRRILRSGDPFTAANTHRLDLMAWLAVAGVAVIAVGSFAEIVVEGELGFGSVGADLDVSAFFLAILATGFLARVWKRGVALQAESNLTI